jgi:hypothetical protein
MAEDNKGSPLVGWLNELTHLRQLPLAEFKNSVDVHKAVFRRHVTSCAFDMFYKPIDDLVRTIGLFPCVALKIVRIQHLLVKFLSYIYWALKGCVV